MAVVFDPDMGWVRAIGTYEVDPDGKCLREAPHPDENLRINPYNSLGRQNR